MASEADTEFSEQSSVPSMVTGSTAPTEADSAYAQFLADDDDDENDNDSAIGSLAEESTSSLSSSVLEYTYENGRRYHAYKAGKYVMPNDEQEQDKLYLSHLINHIAFDGKLFLAPIDRPLERILDVGTGRGEWAIDIAERYPNAVVVGTDLSPIQPLWVPPNVTFEVDDAEDDWLYKRPFDLIHTRTLCGSINDWPRFYQQAYEHLKPGGWIELQENEVWFQREDGTVPHWTLTLLQVTDEASIKMGTRFNVAKEQKQHVIAAGFVDVQEIVYMLPLCEWHDDPKMRELGRLRGMALDMGIEGYTLGLLTRYMGWTADEVQVILAKVRNEYHDPANRMYIAEYVVFGRKPGEPAGDGE